ncbi:MAG: GtrA family protein [Candidatus Korobacteraceae bacterium]|jgi:putative flippase GtrA
MFSLRRYLGRSAALSRRAAAMTFLSSTEAWARLLRRLLKFHMVGVIGIGVQLCFLFAFRTVMHFNYLLATALAVECAVLHNFLWHEHYTWRDRTNGRRLQRLLRFNLSTGLISIVGNLVLMRLLVGSLHLQYMAANILSIGACSLLNFWASDQVVFQAELAPKE